jgi:hypothetical protein
MWLTYIPQVPHAIFIIGINVIDVGIIDVNRAIKMTTAG